MDLEHGQDSALNKRQGRRDKLFHGLLAALAGASLSLVLFWAGSLDIWEARSWDLRASLLARTGAGTDRIRLILVDQESLSWGESVNGLTWPWPREVWGVIAEYCRRQGAKAVVFDILFTEASGYGIADDKELGRALAKSGNAVTAAILGTTGTGSSRWPVDLKAPGMTIEGLWEWIGARATAGNLVFPRAVFPVTEAVSNSKVLANVHLEPDPDGVFRRIAPFGIFDGRVLPVLGLAAYLAGNPDSRVRLGEHWLEVGNLRAPLGPGGEVLLRFRGKSGVHQSYSAASVIQSELLLRDGKAPTIGDNNALRDKYVFIGFAAPGLHDLRPVPTDGTYPGVEVHATFLDNLLSGDFSRTVPAAFSALTVLLVALGVGLATSFLNTPLQLLAMGAATVMLPSLVSLAAYAKGFWVLLVCPQTAAIISFAVALLLNFAAEGRQRRFIKQAFRHYLSPEVIEEILLHPETLRLGGERKVLSIFFSDLQGFTSVSERMEPEQLTRLLNEYLSAMTDIIQAEGGTVDKYEGDAIIAFWNAPLSLPDHAARATRAAIRCQERLTELQPEFHGRIGKELVMRVGINTGPAIVGNMGSHNRFNYTMIGDAVNLASRLEGANKEFGTRTMISQATRDGLPPGLVVRELGRLVVVGRSEPVTVYELLSERSAAEKKEVLEIFARGLQAYYDGDFAAGSDAFAQIADRDAPASAYLARCRTLAGTAPESWGGRWVMDRKG